MEVDLTQVIIIHLYCLDAFIPLLKVCLSYLLIFLFVLTCSLKINAALNRELAKSFSLINIPPDISSFVSKYLENCSLNVMGLCVKKQTNSNISGVSYKITKGEGRSMNCLNHLHEDPILSKAKHITSLQGQSQDLI